MLISVFFFLFYFNAVPPLSEIPEGEWFCYNCEHQVHTEIVCEICQNADNADKLLLCDKCDLGFHIFCLGKRFIFLQEICNLTSTKKKRSPSESNSER